jgi:hypothetical protein
MCEVGCVFSHGMILNVRGYWGGGGYLPKRGRLEGVRELEEELCRLWEVLDLGGLGRGMAAPIGGECGCEAIC